MLCSLLKKLIVFFKCMSKQLPKRKRRITNKQQTHLSRTHVIMESVTVMMRQMLRYMFSIFIVNTKTQIYPNQEECARKVVASICRDDKPIVLVTAEPQVGKTGTMFASMNLIVQSIDMLPNISIDNFFVITGLSDIAWVKQTQERFPKEMSKNILHRNHLKRLKKLIGDKRDVFIFVDEIQIAVQIKQTIDIVFNDCGLHNPDTLKEKGIKLILFSATPNGVPLDLQELGDYVDTIELKPGEAYTSNLNMLLNRRMKQFGFFKNDAYATEVFTTIQAAEEQAGHPLYHIVRLPKDGAKNEEDVITPKKFTEYFKENASYIKLSSSRGNIQDLNNLLVGDIPSKTTIVYIVDSYRCAKTLPKKLIGVWVERKAINMRDDVAIQGNRLVGYDTQPYNYIFTNMESIGDFYEWLRNGCKTGNWKSNTTRGKGDNLASKGTALLPQESRNKVKKQEFAVFPNIDTDTPFNTKDQVIAAFKEQFPDKTFTTRHFHKPNCDCNGKMCKKILKGENNHWVSSKIVGTNGKRWSTITMNHFKTHLNSKTHFDGTQTALIYPIYNSESDAGDTVMWFIKYTI